MTGPLTNAELEAAVARGRKRLDRHEIERVDLAVGDRVWFRHDEAGWDVRAVSADGRWVICTQNDGERYTVLDFDDGVRGPDNYHGLGYQSADEIAEAMAMFERGEAEVSYRSDVYLDIVATARTEGQSQ